MARWSLAVLVFLALLSAWAMRYPNSARAQTRPELRALYGSAQKAFDGRDFELAERLFGRTLVEGYLARGWERRTYGRFREAVDDLEWAARLDPRNLDVQTELGLALFGNRQYQEAARELEKVLAIGRRTPEVLRTLGQAYFSLHRLQSARACFEQALKLDPEDHLTTYLLGIAHLMEKDQAGAFRIFGQLRQAVGDSAQLRLLVARAYQDSGYNRQAETELRRALGIDPKIHFAHYLLGLGALRQDESGRRDEAQREFEAEVAGHPDEFSPLFMLGVVLEMKRDWAQAASHLRQARRLEPNNPDVWFHLGAVELQAGETLEAVKDLEQCLALTAEKSQSHFQVGRAHFLLSRAYRSLGEAEKGAAEAEEARRLSVAYSQWEKEKMSSYLSDQFSLRNATHEQPLISWAFLRSKDAPDTPSPRLEEMYTQVLANSHNYLGLMAAQEDHFEEASRQFHRVAELQPGFPKVDYNLGLASYRAQRLTEAIMALKRAVSNDAGDGLSLDLLGIAEFEHGDFLEALPNLEKAQTTHPDEPGLLLALGTCLVRAQRTVEAQAVFARLLKTRSDTPELHLLLGRAAYAQGDIAQAEVELRKALALDPVGPHAHFHLGMIALDRGDLQKAESEFQAEVEAHPDDHKARYHLAFVLLEEQKQARAVRLLEDILRNTPGYSDAHYSLGKALAEQGQIRRAISELETAIRLDPEKAYSHYQLGRAFLNAGRTAEGQRELERARELKDREHRPETVPAQSPSH